MLVVTYSVGWQHTDELVRVQWRCQQISSQALNDRNEYQIANKRLQS